MVTHKIWTHPLVAVRYRGQSNQLGSNMQYMWLYVSVTWHFVKIWFMKRRGSNLIIYIYFKRKKYIYINLFIFFIFFSFKIRV